MAELINKFAIAGFFLCIATAVVLSAVSRGDANNHRAVIVMMNSDFLAGNGPPTAPCMVLFDIDDPDLDAGELEMLSDVSSQIYDLYSGDAESDGSEEMDAFVKHLKNDTFRANARRQVPRKLSRGRRLFISDILLSRQNFSGNPTHRRQAMVRVTGEETGTVSHLPWDTEPTTEVKEE